MSNELKHPPILSIKEKIRERLQLICGGIILWCVLLCAFPAFTLVATAVVIILIALYFLVKWTYRLLSLPQMLPFRWLGYVLLYSIALIPIACIVLTIIYW